MSAETKVRERDRAKPPKQTTGLPFLDQILGGGLPTKSLVCFLMDSASGAEILLYQFASTHKTYYFSNVRRPEDITRIMKDLNMDSRNIKFIGGDEAKYMFANSIKKVQSEVEPCNVIIDSFSFFLNASSSPENIRKLLDLIRDVTTSRDGVAFLLVYKNTHPKEVENVVLNASDAIFDIECHTSGERQETILSIPKIRGTTPIGRIKVTLGEKIKIDTAREIA